MALDHFPVRKVNLRKDPQTPDDSGDRVPGHLHDVAGLWALFRCWRGRGFHLEDSILGVSLSPSWDVNAWLWVRLQPLP